MRFKRRFKLRDTRVPGTPCPVCGLELGARRKSASPRGARRRAAACRPRSQASPVANDENCAVAGRVDHREQSRKFLFGQVFACRFHGVCQFNRMLILLNSGRKPAKNPRHFQTSKADLAVVMLNWSRSCGCRLPGGTRLPRSDEWRGAGTALLHQDFYG